MNHEQASTLKSTKLKYSASLFIHTIGSHVSQLGLRAKTNPTNLGSKFPSCQCIPRNFCSCATNAVFDDTDELGLYHVEPPMDYYDFENQLHVLEDNLHFDDAGSMWQYDIYGIDMTDVPPDLIYSLKRGVTHLARDIQQGGGSSFDTTRPCAICGDVGHTFAGCPSLKDHEKIKRAFIWLKLAVNKTFDHVAQIRNPKSNDLQSLAALNINSIEQQSSLGHTSTPLALPLSSSSSNATDVLVSTLRGMQTEMSNMSSGLSSLSSVVRDLLSSGHSASVDKVDGDTDSNGNTDESIVAFLNSEHRWDFRMGQG